MLSGVVQVNLDGLGNLSLVGDSSQHYVEITSTPNGTYDQFTITSKDGTLFELNGVLPTLTSVAVDGVTGDINVNLGNGGPNTFDFEAPSSNAGAVSTVLGNLTITDNSVETNKINNVVIQGNLTVVDGSNGYHEFDALGTQVNGVTEIDNSGVVTGTPAPGNFSGDSYTNITNCVFEGLSVNTQTAGNTQTVGAAAVTSDASTPLQRQTAIDNGLTYLESQQNADGSWTNSYGYNTATTALVVEALALRGGPGAATNLSNGLNYLLTPSLSGLTVTNLGGKTGVYFSGGEQTYITSIVLPALVTVGGFSTSTGIVDPRTGDVMTRGDVIQAICNQISAGQHTDGGWRYTLSDTADPTPSDNSVSQWASLALLYAQTAGFSNTVNYANLAAFVNSVQSTAPGTNQGGSDYQPGVGWINESKTAGLLVEHNLGLLNGVSDIGNTDLALQYLNAHWLDGGAEGFAANFGSAYAMWSVYKGLESTIGLNNTTTITNLMTPGAANWWDDQCQYLIGTQNGDGSWTDQGEGGFAFAFDPGMTTAIDIMILNGTPIPSGQAPALKIDNGVGNNQVYVRAMSPPPQETSGIDTAQIGYETAATPAAPVALLVNNGLGATASFFGGGSNVTITDPAGSAVPVIYGAVEINNGQTLPLQSNQVNFVGAVVYGGVNVTNQVGGDTSTSIQQSKLGEQLENNAPVQVVNQGSGANQFLMTGSDSPGAWPSLTISRRTATRRSSTPASSARPAAARTPRSRRVSAFPARNPATWPTSAAAPTASAAPTRSWSATAR